MSEKKWASFGENIFVNAPIGIFTTDHAGIINSANRVSLKIHGEMTGKVFPQDFVQGKRLNFDIRELYEERVGRLEVEYETGQPTRIIRLISTLLRNEYYCPIGILHMCQDITELRDAQDRVGKIRERLDYAGRLREIGLLARGVVHDIRHIFSIILNYIFALKTGNCSKEEVGHFLEIMEQTSRDAVEMTQEIITLSLKGTSTIERVDVNRIISDLSGIIAKSLPDNITIQVNIPRRPLFLEGNSSQIKRILLNLCLNARDAMPCGGQITITLRKEKPREKSLKQSEYMSLTVSDTGEGIKTEHRAEIFKPLFTTRKEGRGIGLGLCVVREAVENSGGYINLQSTPGEGSTFTVLFPVSPKRKKPSKSIAKQHGVGIKPGRRKTR